MPASSNRALRYFSTHCCKKKQAASGTMSFRRQRICKATLKSFSAFLTHSRVMGFIHHLALFHDFADEKVTLMESFRHFRRCSYQQIKSKITRNGMSDPHR